jgi:hypothetical protein
MIYDSTAEIPICDWRAAQRLTKQVQNLDS